MIQTKYGPFDGDSWEEAFQRIFKKKYQMEGYQEMPASPGDFGIEGFVKNLGIAFQCYCPDKVYTQDELYIKQRDKITKDLAKLQKYESYLSERLGNTSIKKWYFISPDINHNNLLKHVQSKRLEVLRWNLSIIDNEFDIELQDIDFYASEINDIRKISGDKVVFFQGDIERYLVREVHNDYEKNIERKNFKRCLVDGVLNKEKHEKLNSLTVKRWLESGLLFRDIEVSASNVFYEIARVVSQYEDEVVEICLTWDGKAEDLVRLIRNGLVGRFKESIPDIGISEIYKITDIMVANWIAHCPLEIE